MDKVEIRYKLIESLNTLGLFEDKDSSTKKADKADNEKDDKEKGEVKVLYDDVVNFFKRQPAIKQVAVFRDAGFSEEEIYQRLPYKKLNKDKNKMGGEYSFNTDEVDRLRTQLSKYPTGGKMSKS